LELSIFPELRRLRGDPDITQKTAQAYAPFVRAGSDSEHARISVTGKVDDNSFSLETTVMTNSTGKLLNGKTATNEDVVRFL
jgi:hypothetical protein